jgi:hypothetical protein
MKRYYYLLAVACSLASGTNAFSTVVTPATGGLDISADSAVTSAWTTVGPIVIGEGNGNPQRGDFQKGTNVTLVLKAPAGFQFNTTVIPNVAFTAGKDVSAASATVNDSSTLTLTFTITGTNNTDQITIGSATGLQVRATSGTPLAVGNIYRPIAGGTAGIAGITSTANADGSNGTSFCALAETAGNATKLTFVTQPDGAVISQAFLVQPVIRCQDQFNNITSRGLPSTLAMTTVLSGGTGALHGTRTNNIGTAGGNGVVTHTDLYIDGWGPNKELTVSAPGLASATTAKFAVNKLTQTITFDPISDKVYGDLPFTVSATASSGLTVTFDIVSGPATIAGNTITLTGPGTVTVRAVQEGNNEYLAASATNSFVVSGVDLRSPRLTIQRLSNGTVSLKVAEGSANQTCCVQVADTLEGTWESLDTVVLDSNGEKVLEDTSSSPMRFYRISTP